MPDRKKRQRSQNRGSDDRLIAVETSANERKYEGRLVEKEKTPVKTMGPGFPCIYVSEDGDRIHGENNRFHIHLKAKPQRTLTLNEADAYLQALLKRERTIMPVDTISQIESILRDIQSARAMIVQRGEDMPSRVRVRIGRKPCGGNHVGILKGYVNTQRNVYTTTQHIKKLLVGRQRVDIYLDLRVDAAFGEIMFSDSDNVDLQTYLGDELDSETRITNAKTLNSTDESDRELLKALHILKPYNFVNPYNFGFMYHYVTIGRYRLKFFESKTSKSCLRCNCEFNIMEYYPSTSASPTVQMRLERQGKQYFMKCFITPKDISTNTSFTSEVKTELRRLEFESQVYAFITNYFKGTLRNWAGYGITGKEFKKNFVLLGNESCEYSSMFELYKRIDVNSCKDCKRQIVRRLADTICSKEHRDWQLCNMEDDDQVNAFVKSVHIKAIVTTLCPGTVSLRSFLQNTGITTADKTQVIVKLANTVNFMHSKLRLYHLDMHSDNILVCKKNGQYEPLMFDWDRATCTTGDLQNPDNNAFSFYIPSKELKRIQNNRDNKLDDLFKIIDRVYLFDNVIRWCRRTLPKELQGELAQICIGIVDKDFTTFIQETLKLRHYVWQRIVRTYIKSYFYISVSDTVNVQMLSQFFDEHQKHLVKKKKK